MTTLGTEKKWSLFGGGRYSEGQTLILINILIQKFRKTEGGVVIDASLLHN